ncbi:hypothetical protein ACH5RR_019288 [Cinchona calisaya]|uniref:Mitochondrial glycoprotein n=1 Tax=Cinchona calisaya TaxID=153742 RepID=A0ABD2ZP76_9GENT
MALTNALRRAASRVVPSAARVFQVTNPRYTHHGSAVFAAVHRRSDLSNTVFERSFPSNFRHFSTRQSASDESLVKIIEEEIQCALNSDQNINKVEELPQSFPFKLQDNPGLYTVTLTREYQGETIVVEVQMPSTVTGEHADIDDDGDAGDEKGAQSELPLVVRVSKSRGPCLEFNCTAFPDDISIDSLSVRDPDISEDQIGYEGPEFTDLDENLQKAFHKYLEIRGVKPSTTNFLHEYMINKDDREYVRWLKNLKKFVEA